MWPKELQRMGSLGPSRWPCEADRETSPVSCLAEPDIPERIRSEYWLSISISVRGHPRDPYIQLDSLPLHESRQNSLLKSQTVVSAFGSRDCTETPRKVGGYLENTLDTAGRPGRGTRVRASREEIFGTSRRSRDSDAPP